MGFLGFGGGKEKPARSAIGHVRPLADHGGTMDVPRTTEKKWNKLRRQHHREQWNRRRVSIVPTLRRVGREIARVVSVFTHRGTHPGRR